MKISGAGHLPLNLRLNGTESYAFDFDKELALAWCRNFGIVFDDQTRFCSGDPGRLVCHDATRTCLRCGLENTENLEVAEMEVRGKFDVNDQIIAWSTRRNANNHLMPNRYSLKPGMGK